MDFCTNPFFHGKSFMTPCSFLEHNCAGNMRIWLSLSKIEFTVSRIPFDIFPATFTGTEKGSRPGNADKNEFNITLILPLHLSPVTFNRVKPSIPPSGWFDTKHSLSPSLILRFSSPIILILISRNFREALTKSKPTLLFPSVARNWFNSSWWMRSSSNLTKNLGSFLPSFSWISFPMLIWNMIVFFYLFSWWEI